jgi:hypothetical protein
MPVSSLVNLGIGAVPILQTPLIVALRMAAVYLCGGIRGLKVISLPGMVLSKFDNAAVVPHNKTFLPVAYNYIRKLL